MRTRHRSTSIAAVALALAFAATGCRGDARDELPAFPPTPVPSTNGSPSGSPTLPSTPPTGSPGVTGTLTIGTAQVTTSGALTVSATYDTLGPPGIWTPPPGAISLNWRGRGAQSLGITGDSFAAQLPTAPDRVLEFSVRGPDSVLTFRSSEGECLVTISPALVNQVGGSFTCTGLASDDGSVTVNALGTFSAE
jgi:hypothetical protein